MPAKRRSPSPARTLRTPSHGPCRQLLRFNAKGLEGYCCGRSAPAMQPLRFVLSCAYALRLRASDLLGSIGTVASQDSWLHLVGQGTKTG